MKYEQPNIEIIKLNYQDVIITSLQDVDSNLGGNPSTESGNVNDIFG